MNKLLELINISDGEIESIIQDEEKVWGVCIESDEYHKVGDELVAYGMEIIKSIKFGSAKRWWYVSSENDIPPNYRLVRESPFDVLTKGYKKQWAIDGKGNPIITYVGRDGVLRQIGFVRNSLSLVKGERNNVIR